VSKGDLRSSEVFGGDGLLRLLIHWSYVRIIHKGDLLNWGPPQSFDGDGAMQMPLNFFQGFSMMGFINGSGVPDRRPASA
jgi:hypothetical protein